MEGAMALATAAATDAVEQATDAATEAVDQATEQATVGDGSGDGGGEQETATVAKEKLAPGLLGNAERLVWDCPEWGHHSADQTTSSN